VRSNALLNLVYLEPEGDLSANRAELRRLAEPSGKLNLRCDQIAPMAEIEPEECEPLKERGPTDSAPRSL
jgi:hypothetical protein